jgi:hypothetical protein
VIETNNYIKRVDIFCICKELYDITVLTDTHCCLENESQWLGEWGYIGKFSCYSSRSRGVVVLFKNSFEFKINSEILDTNLSLMYFHKDKFYFVKTGRNQGCHHLGHIWLPMSTCNLGL